MTRAASEIFRLMALLILFQLLGYFPCVGRERQPRRVEPKMFVVATVRPASGVVGQELLYEARLYSESDVIAQVRVAENPNFGSLKVYDTGGDTSISTVTYKGNEYYSAVVDRYYIDCDEPGRFSVKGGTYTVYIPSARVVNDPFWGPRRQTVYENLTLTASDVTLKVSALPPVPSGFNFSGAIGEFEVTSWLPEGDIKAGEEAVAVVTVAGEGNLTDASIPDLKGAFSGDVRLRSVSEERTRFMKNGALWEELELECTFIPTPADGSDKCTIGRIAFGFFSPSRKRYVEVFSEPLDIDLSNRRAPGRSSRQEALGI